MSHLMNTYSRIPVAFARGEGVWVWDEAGKRYLDALAGIAVNTLGHGHPKLTRAIAEQSLRLIHASNLYRIAEQETLAEKLAAISGMENAFFCNSGCEANEAAIKLARLYGHGKGVESPAIVVMDRAFHGRTLATLSATGNRKVLAGPIQGEGGINVSTMQYLRDLREICDRQGWLLMVDEVQCGLGRTGKWFVYQHAGIRPDVVLLAKGLASGVPIGVCLAGGPAAQLFQPGTHGSTFGGNPLACAAALATLTAIEDEGLMKNAERIGGILLRGLRDSLGGQPGVVEVRGQGLMIGVELERPCGDHVERALDAGLLINVTMDKVIRLLPPLVIGEAEARQVLAILVPLAREFLAQAPAEAAARA